MLLCLQPCFSLFLFSWASDTFKLPTDLHFLLLPWSYRLPSVFTIYSECILFLVTQHPFPPFILSNTSLTSFIGITSSPWGGLSKSQVSPYFPLLLCPFGTHLQFPVGSCGYLCPERSSLRCWLNPICAFPLSPMYHFLWDAFIDKTPPISNPRLRRYLFYERP